MGGLVPFDDSREVERENLEPGNRYRVAFSLDGMTTQVRNVCIEIDACERKRMRWCDDVWQPFPAINEHDFGLLVDDLDPNVRFAIVPSLVELLSSRNELVRPAVPTTLTSVGVAQPVTLEALLAAESEWAISEQERKAIDEINYAFDVAAVLDREGEYE
jgi:hypothetical protein